MKHHQSHLHGSQGQIAIGLAFSFLTFLAVFSLIFQSTLLTRERITLQTSTDYAALVGASVQKAALNVIHARNTEIDQAFAAAQTLMAIPYCLNLGIGRTPGEWHAQLAVQTMQTVPSMDCGKICDKYESFMRQRIADAYTTSRTALATDIYSMLLQSPAVAAHLAEQAVLSVDNLPLRLQSSIRRKRGKNISATQLVQDYHSGAFGNTLKLENSFTTIPDGVPLFVADEEARHFMFGRSIATLANTSPPQCFLAPAIRPGMIAVSGKVIRSKQSWPTHFVMATRYNPPTSFVEGAFNLRIQDPQDNRGHELNNQNDNLLPMAQDNDPRRMMMQVIAMAKPYGGIHPSHKSSGQPFSGVKLVGLADHSNMEGWDPVFMPLSVDGRPIFWREYLH